MNVVRKNLRFAMGLGLFALLVLGELSLIYEWMVSAREAARRLTDRQVALERMAQLMPPPTRETSTAIEQDLQKAKAALASMQHALQARGAVAGQLRLARVPVARTDSYFDLATFVERTRQLAQKHGVKVRPEADRFGFSAFAHEGPFQDHIEPVFRQRLLAQYLVESLIEAGPRSIVSVKREPTLSRVERDAWAAARAGGEQPAEVQPEGGPDYFALDPRMSARGPDLIDTTAFQLVFTGQTAVLRTFLNRIASFELPVLVREVEVNTATADETAEQPPPDDAVVPPEEGERVESAASLVLSVVSPPLRSPAGASTPAGAADRTPRPSNAVPVVSRPLSRFTVTVEFVHFVTPAAAPTGAPARGFQTAPGAES